MLLTLRQLEILVAAADAPTFSEAAARIGISQPSLSETIRRAELELNVKLFDRTTRSVTLTEEGRYVVAVAREMIRNFRQGLENIARWSGTRRGRITVAGLPSVACAVLPAAIRRFVQEHPDVEINVHDLPHERAIAAVEHGMADLALTIRPAKLKECRFEELGADRLYLVCPPDHPLMKKEKVSWRDLAPYPFVGLSRGSSVRRMTDAAFVNREIFIEPAYELEQIPSAVALVEAGLGISALPALTLTMVRGARVATKPLFDPVMKRRIGVVTLAGRQPSNFILSFIKVLRETFNELRLNSGRDPEFRFPHSMTVPFPRQS